MDCFLNDLFLDKQNIYKQFNIFILHRNRFASTVCTCSHRILYNRIIAFWSNTILSFPFLKYYYLTFMLLMISLVKIAMKPITTFSVSRSLYRVCGIQLCSQRGFMLNGFETRHRDQKQKSKPVLSQQKLWLTGLMILKSFEKNRKYRKPFDETIGNKLFST